MDVRKEQGTLVSPHTADVVYPHLMTAEHKHLEADESLSKPRWTFYKNAIMEWKTQLLDPCLENILHMWHFHPSEARCPLVTHTHTHTHTHTQSNQTDKGTGALTLFQKNVLIHPQCVLLINSPLCVAALVEGPPNIWNEKFVFIYFI